VTAVLSAALALLLLSTPARADSLLRLATRPGVTVPLYYMKRADARATLVLLPGGAGGLGIKNGAPTSANFLVRSRDLFAAGGFHVAVLGRPSDRRELDYEDRVSAEHMADLRRVVAFLEQDAGLPVWLVGTSRGTVSAAAAAIAFGNDSLAGIVLTSSVTSRKKTGAVPTQKLAAIRVPVLVVHHGMDACPVCDPREAPAIINGLKNAPIKKLLVVSGGANPSGDACGSRHWHGYIGMEREVAALITAWIRSPAP
jgi:hypothetical protein